MDKDGFINTLYVLLHRQTFMCAGNLLCNCVLAICNKTLAHFNQHLSIWFGQRILCLSFWCFTLKDHMESCISLKWAIISIITNVQNETRHIIASTDCSLYNRIRYSCMHCNDMMKIKEIYIHIRVWLFNNPPVIDIFECIAGDLLLGTAPSAIVVFYWVQMGMWM